MNLKVKVQVLSANKEPKVSNICGLSLTKLLKTLISHAPQKRFMNLNDTQCWYHKHRTQASKHVRNNSYFHSYSDN